MPNKRKTSWESLTTDQQAFLIGSTTSSDEPVQRSVRRDEAVLRPSPAADEATSHAPRQPVTLRLPLPLVRALRRAAAERSLDYDQPYTQQAIVESALDHWLRSAGYQQSATEPLSR